MAEVAVPSISTAIPTDADTVVGVQAGAVKRFTVADLRRTAANPTATVGLTAKPGVATTFMRSDAAPAIDPAVVPTFVAADGKVNQSANINSPALYTAAVSGLYRVSAFVAITRAATTSSTMPNVSVSYTEAMSGAAVQDIVTQQGNTNLVGLHSGDSTVFNAQQGANIGYITSGYASAGATTMQYGVQVKIEFVG